MRNSFALMALLLLCSIGVMYWVGAMVVHLTAKSVEADMILDNLKSTLSTLKDAETGQRGYLLTGKTKYLDPYHSAVSHIGGNLLTLDGYARAGLLDPKDVAQLRELTNQKLSELDQTIQVRNQQGLEAAVAVVESDIGEQTMRQIRAAVAVMIDRQNATLSQTLTKSSHATRARTIVFVVVGLTNLLFLVWAFRRIHLAILQKDRATSELHEQKELLGVTLASIGDGVIVTDLHGKISYLNPEAEKLTGWTLADARQRPCADVFNIINESSRKLVESPVDKVIRSGAIVGLANHTLLIRKDGSELPIDDSGAPIKNADGILRGVVLVFRDFSGHKENEKKLKDTLFLLDRVTNATPDLIFAKDRTGRMLLANKATLAMVGKSSEEILGKLETEWHDDFEQASAIMANDRRIMESGIAEDVEEIFSGIHGRRVYRSSKSPMIDDNGVVFGIAGVSQDITDSKKAGAELAAAKEAAEAANIAKDNFLATLSHELRTPLSPVLATLNIWESGGDIPQALLGDVLMMRRNVELEARLIDDLLDLTRIVKGKLSLNLEIVDLHALIEAVVSMHQSETYGKQLGLVVHLDAEQHHVYGDSARLQQVLWNIFKNAIKFTPTGGSIEVSSVNDHNGFLKVVFTDTGIGMTSEMLSRLFEPFEQGSAETMRRYGGLGLGMAISRSLLKAQGGEITATSAGPGRGATFTATMKCVALQDLERHQPMKLGDTASARALNILLVEDHADTARAMSRLLRRQGHTVRAATNVADALESAKQPFDLLLSDIGLPDGTGVDLIRTIRKIYGQQFTAIALTGFGMEDDIARCKEAGFNHQLTKPVNLQNLERMLQQVTLKPQ